MKIYILSYGGMDLPDNLIDVGSSLAMEYLPLENKLILKDMRSVPPTEICIDQIIHCVVKEDLIKFRGYKHSKLKIVFRKIATEGEAPHA